MCAFQDPPLCSSTLRRSGILKYFIIALVIILNIKQSFFILRWKDVWQWHPPHSLSGPRECSPSTYKHKKMYLWCSYITVNFATAASLNGVCIAKQMCHIMICSMIKDESDKKPNTFFHFLNKIVFLIKGKLISTSSVLWCKPLQNPMLCISTVPVEYTLSFQTSDRVCISQFICCFQ